MKGLSSDTFRAYISGGRLWPQRRWSIVMYQLHALNMAKPEDPLNERSLNTFFEQRPSTKQMSILRRIMDEDHRRIGLKLMVNNEMLRDEYEKSVMALNSVVQAWAEDHHCSIVHRLPLTQRQEFARLVSLCIQCMKQHKDLARLFRLTYHVSWSTQTKEELEQLDLWSKLHTDKNADKYQKDIKPALREAIIIHMFTILRETLVKYHGAASSSLIADDAWPLVCKK